MVRKPSGKIGPNLISTNGVTWEKIDLPDDKAELEQFLIAMFDRSLTPTDRRKLQIESIVQNPNQDDLDCTVVRDCGDRLMDIVEIAPLEKIKGKYDNASGTFKVGEFADCILLEISKKSAKYVAIDRPWLLCVITHWAFLPSQTIFGVLGVELVKTPHVFERIFFMAPMDDKKGLIENLYPVSLERVLAYLNVEKFRENTLFNLDPNKLEPSKRKRAGP